ncbi:hypothetical protein AHF37_11367 [Paragonimus kellicotti]|nr:hypothetical protein AHF37_11367 [Paragonimus kellicotti]
MTSDIAKRQRTVPSAKAFEFNWRRPVPDVLQKGAVFDRFDEVSFMSAGENIFFKPSGRVYQKSSPLPNVVTRMAFVYATANGIGFGNPQFSSANFSWIVVVVNITFRSHTNAVSF